MALILALLLSLSPCTTPPLHAYAQAKAISLASDFRHSTADELAQAGSAGWVSLGENIGRGSSVQAILWGWENSPAHKAILDGDWTHTALGTYHDGYLWHAALITMDNPSETRCQLVMPVAQMRQRPSPPILPLPSRVAEVVPGPQAPRQPHAFID